MSKIKNFWILSTSGIPLFLLKGDDQQNILIGGFFSALQILIDSLEHSHFNKIELEDRTYFYYFKDPIISVLEAEASSETETQVYQIITQQLGKAFTDMFSNQQITDFIGDLAYYNEFRPKYESIIQDIEGMLQQSHKEFLSKYFVEAARDEDILGIVIYDLEKDEIISRDTPPDCAIDDFESFGSMLFAFLSRLGKELKTGQINEVLVRGQKYWVGGFRKGSLAVFMMFDLKYFGKVLPEFVNAPLENID